MHSLSHYSKFKNYSGALEKKSLAIDDHKKKIKRWKGVGESEGYSRVGVPSAHKAQLPTTITQTRASILIPRVFIFPRLYPFTRSLARPYRRAAINRPPKLALAAAAIVY